MALDFPSSPAVGDKYPVSPIVGVPTYTWDGTAWMTSGSPVGQYVAKSGDTMTGDLTVAEATPAIRLNKSASGQEAQIWGSLAGVNRWKLTLGDSSPETGSQAGSAFTLHSRSDDGTLRQLVLTAPRDTGLLSVAGDPTAALGIATKQYVDAGDVAGLAASGMQINGSFDVSQELGFSNPVVSKYFCDGFRFDITGTMVAVCGAYPTGTFPGFINCLSAVVTTAQSTLGAGDYAVVAQSIEGYRVARLGWGTANAQPLTIGFWTAHHRPGTYSIAVRNKGSSRTYAATYTHNTADTPQFNTITIPGDTTGTWATDNTVGININFPMACGTTYCTAAGNWTASNFLAAVGQVNGVAATSDIFRITGVIVLPGVHTITAAQSPLLMRPYDQELIICQRYYQKYPGCLFASYGGAAALFYVEMYFPQMRVAPAVSFANINYGNSSGLVFRAAYTNHLNVQATVTNSGGVWAIADTTCDARL